MKRGTRTSAQVFRKLLPFLFLLCLGTLLFFGSKIMGGCEPPSGRDGTQLIFGTILNLILLTLNAALFCVFEACQLITDLRVHPTHGTEVLFMHFLKAGLPLLCVILGKWCWKISRQDDSATQAMTAQPAYREHFTIANFLTGHSQTQRFLRELALFSCMLLALSPFHSRLMAAPSNLVESIRLYTFSQKLMAEPSSHRSHWDELRMAQAYANLGEYKKSFAVIDAILAKPNGPVSIHRLDDIYSCLPSIDPSKSASAAEWLKLTSYADNNLEALFRSVKPDTAADGTWNRNKNKNTNGTLKCAANSLIRASQKHGCTKQEIKWIEAKGILQRKLLGADSANLQNISINLYRDLAQTEENQNYAPLLQKNIALLECTPSSNSEYSLSEHERIESLRYSLEDLEKLTGASTSSKQARPSLYLKNFGEVKARLQKELALAKQSGNYGRARDKARDIARLIYRHCNTVSKEAASYYNQMVELESRAPVSQETQLSHLVEASKSNIECGNIKEGEAYLAKIQILRTSLFGEHYDGQARDLNSHALACIRKGNQAEARGLYEKALKLDTENLGARNKAIAIYLNNLGHISVQLKDFDQAEKYYQQALVIDKNAPCEMLDVASDYENLGRLYLERGQKATALKNLVAAREAKSQMLGADAVEVVDLDKTICQLNETGPPEYKKAA